ncbi:MAG: helix-turn-helix domain-containing protein [Bacillota bacterium]
MNTYIVSFTDEEAAPIQVEVSADTEAEAIEQARKIASTEAEELEFVSIIQVQPVDIELVYTAAEAGELWNLGTSTVKRACQTGRFAPWEARKSGGTWLVTRAAMERVYGPKPSTGPE